MLLALDTSTDRVSVALLDGGVVRAEGRGPAGQKHGETLAPLIAAALAEAGVSAVALVGVVVGVGPGPFTGLRVGLVTAAALGSALAIPVAGVCSLDGLLAEVGGAGGASGDLVAVTDARRKEVYWARYSGGVRVDGPHVEKPAVLAERLAGSDVTLRGPGADLYADVFVAVGLTVRTGAQLSASLLGGRVLAGHQDAVLPMYLRRPDAVEPAVRTIVTPEV